MKRCTKCGVEKDESEFHRSLNTKDSLTHKCKTCCSVYSKAYYKTNRDKVRASTQKWAEANRDRKNASTQKWAEANRDRKNASKQKWAEANREKANAHSKRSRMRAHRDPTVKARNMVNSSKARAIKAGIPHSITFKDLLPIPNTCPVLGVPMVLSGEQNHGAIASLDRLIPELGYVKGNVCVISRRANTLKSNATIEELELVLAYMKRHAAQQEQGSEPNNT